MFRTSIWLRPLLLVPLLGCGQDWLSFGKHRPLSVSRTSQAETDIEPETRAPLAPFDQTQSDGLIVHTDLPGNQYALPGAPDIRWWRGNAWAVTIPGLPFVPAGSSVHPERVASWFLDRYSPDWQQTILDTHRRRGYTHYVLSWPDSRDGNGQSVAQFVATAQKVHDAGFYTVVFLGSKDFDPANQTAAVWAPRVDPVIDALTQAGVMDVAVVGWELDLWNIPGDPLQGIIDHITSKTVPAGVPTYVHFSTEHISWQNNGTSSLDWWNLQRGKLTGILYQGDPSWDVGMYQARLNDVQTRFAVLGDSGFGHPFDVVAWEVVASAQFDGPVDEDRGDLIGYELLCTPGPLPIMGFGNGARLPDGRSTASHNLPPKSTTSETFAPGQLSLTQGNSIALISSWLVLQGDGNLVIYDNSGNPLWSSGTPGINCTSCELDFQGDGNLVLYNAGNPYWATGTNGQGATSLLYQVGQPYLQIQNGGGTALWTSGGSCAPSCGGKRCGPDGCGGSCGSCSGAQDCDGSGQCAAPQCAPSCGGRACGGDGCGGSCGSCGNSESCDGSGQCVAGSCGVLAAAAGLTSGQDVSSCDGRFDFAMQGDGNLVLYQSGSAIWASNTAGSNGANLLMQGDGNLVIYQSGSPIWSSGTPNNPGAWLAVQNDGNVVIYSNGQPLWSTGTAR